MSSAPQTTPATGEGGKSTEIGLHHWGDILVVVVYFLLVLAVGFWVSDAFTLNSC